MKTLAIFFSLAIVGSASASMLIAPKWDKSISDIPTHIGSGNPGDGRKGSQGGDGGGRKGNGR